MGLRRREHHHPLNAGFTLIEMLMALLVLTVGLLGLLQSVNVAYEHNVRNRLREAATLVAEEQMNAFRRMTSSSGSYANRMTVSRIVSGVGKTFTVTRESRPMQDTRRLRVTVGWGFKNQSTTHTIYTLKKI
jgi:type IV pilus assembly protein PilV